MPSLEAVWPILLGLLLLGILLGVRLARWGRQRRGRRVAKRGARGEADGVALLKEAGFEVLEVQVRASTVVHVDDEETVFDLWVDAIARRDGLRYVAEFKTGAVATIAHASTRRQLLEYATAFPDHGLVLVDASEGRVYEIGFPRLRALTGHVD